MAKVRRQHFDFSDAERGLDKLGKAKESIARAMGASMGVVVRDEAILRVPVGTDIGGSKFPGLLKSALYVAYDERRNVLNPDRFRYVVSWNSKKAPHGHLIEFGHWMPYLYATDKLGNYWTPKPLQPQSHPYWVGAQPFLGPAFDAKIGTLYEIGLQAAKGKYQEVMGR